MTTHYDYERPADFAVGDRVQLHPALDLWMRGVRFGNVTKIGRKYVHVKPDNYRRVRISPENLGKVAS